MKRKYGNLVGGMLTLVVQGMLVLVPSVALADGGMGKARNVRNPRRELVRVSAGSRASGGRSRIRPNQASARPARRHRETRRAQARARAHRSWLP